MLTMTRLQAATELLRIEAACVAARADLLDNNNSELLTHLNEVRRRVGDILVKILCGDETHLYLAK